MTTAGERHHRRARVWRLAQAQHGVVTRAQLLEMGVTTSAIAAEIRAHRWRRVGKHTICAHTGELSREALWRYAVWEAGSRAALDGTTGLAAAGVTGVADAPLDVSITGGLGRRHVPGVVPHHVGPRLPHEVIEHDGLSRVHPAIAGVRAAAWARSDRQSALWLVLPVQQRIVRPDELLAASDLVGVRERRGLITRLVRDIADGSHSLNELDFAAECRARGLPEPDRQVVCRTAGGRYYLDVRWTAIGLVIEIDGVHHTQGLAPVDDALRQNEVTLRRDTVLRIPLLAFRLDRKRMMDQVVRAHAELTARAARR